MYVRWFDLGAVTYNGLDIGMHTFHWICFSCWSTVIRRQVAKVNGCPMLTQPLYIRRSNPGNRHDVGPTIDSNGGSNGGPNGGPKSSPANVASNDQNVVVPITGYNVGPTDNRGCSNVGLPEVCYLPYMGY